MFGVIKVKYAWEVVFWLGDAIHYRRLAHIGERYAHRVGQKLPNPWGLYDMHGKVFEWCQDWYAPYGCEKAVSDPGSPASGDRRVLRGGSFVHGAESCRSAFRGYWRPEFLGNPVGFRVSRTCHGQAHPPVSPSGRP